MSDDILSELLTLGKVIDGHGRVTFTNCFGEKHRIHGPALLCEDGTQVWFRNGVKHRTTGPAVTWADGEEWWYLDGKRLTHGEWERAVDPVRASIMDAYSIKY